MSQLPDPYSQPQFYRDVPMKRLLAWGVDVIVIALACLVLLPFTAFTGLFFFPAMMVVVGFVYRVITLANGSATWGMRLFAIELRRGDGARLDAGTAVAHTAGYAFSCVMAPLQFISVIMMCITQRRQGLTDHVLGTAMVNRRATL